MVGNRVLAFDRNGITSAARGSCYRMVLWLHLVFDGILA